VRIVSWCRVNARSVAFTAALALALALIAVRSFGGSSEADDPPAANASGSRTALVVLENHEFGEVIGSSELPYLNRLAKRGALAVRYYAVAHPSLPNYLAMAGGSTFGITDDCTDCHASGPNLATQLSAARVSWRAYMEGMPGACSSAAESGVYAKRHNPFLYFPSVTSSPRVCRNDVPGDELDEDLGEHDLPTFAWITPDLCADAHNCALSETDDYLRKLVPRLMRQLGPHGLLVITFDEGASNAGCCGNASGGRVATILLGPDVARGVRLRTRYSHYSLLAALEDRFGVKRLRKARKATPLPFGEGRRSS